MKKFISIVVMLSAAATAHAGVARLSYHYALKPGGKIVVEGTKFVAKTPGAAAKVGKKTVKSAVKVLY